MMVFGYGHEAATEHYLGVIEQEWIEISRFACLESGFGLPEVQKTKLCARLSL